jgi:Rad3-related DNA helicase
MGVTMDIAGANSVKAQLALVGLKSERQSQQALATVVGQVLESGKEIAAQAATGPGKAVDTSA